MEHNILLYFVLLCSYWNEVLLEVNANTGLHSSEQDVIYAPYINETQQTCMHFILSHSTVINSIFDLMYFWKWKNSMWILESNAVIMERQINETSKARNMEIHLIHINLNSTFVNLTGVIINGKLCCNYVVIAKSQALMQVVQWIKSSKSFVARTSWIILYNKWPIDDFPSALQIESRIQLTLMTLQPVSSLSPTNKCSKFGVSFYDVFYSIKTKKIEVIKFAVWNVNDKLQFVNLHFKLLSRPFYGITYHHPPQASVNNESHITGSVVSMFKFLAEVLEMQLIIEATEGFIYANQKIPGVFTNVSIREHDCIILNVGLTASRKQLVHFTPSIGISWMQVLIRTPEESDGGLNFTLYLKPFNYKVWIFLSLLFIVNAAFLAVGQRCLNYASPYWDSNWLVWILSGSWIIEIFCKEFRGLSLRIFFHTLILMAYVTFCCYSSVFTSFLTVEDDNLPFRDIYEFADSKEYVAAIATGTTYEEYFRNAPIGSPLSKIWFKVITDYGNGLVVNRKEGLERVYNGKYAFMCQDKQDLLDMKAMGRNFMYIPNVKLLKEFDYLAIRADFPYMTAISKLILRAKENGVMHRFIEQYSYTYKTNVPARRQRKMTLGLGDVISLFVLLASGIALSLITLFIEICIEKMKM